jgi:3-methyladenine DNA glycosylase AlkD
VPTTELVPRIVEAFESARDPAAARPMERYMRDQFAFLGIPTPARRALQREALAGSRPDRDELLHGARALWQRAEREYQYAARDVLVRGSKLFTVDDIDALGRLVTTKAWWDTVDVLAIHVIGSIVRRDRGGALIMDAWLADDDLWLARTAILHQNRWKADTDEDRLFAYCQARAADTDFFVRKAIGWALREYSKSAPDAVRAFVAAHDHELSGLSKREALKVVNRGS